MKNKDIREAIAKSGLKYWQVAERLGIADGTLSRKLRKELPAGEKNAIFAVIDELKKEAIT